MQSAELQQSVTRESLVVGMIPVLTVIRGEEEENTFVVVVKRRERMASHFSPSRKYRSIGAGSQES